MAKRVRLSDDDATYYTLPGNSGEFRNEAGELTDTIFGQPYESSESGLITGTLTSNALYKGFAGYVVLIKKSGTTTALTDEPMSLVSGKIYQVTDAAKHILDPDVALTFEDNAVAIPDASIESINFLTGTVTLAAAYTVTGAITIASGSYFPMTEVAGTRSWTLGMTVAAIDDTDIPTARANSGTRTFTPNGLRSVSLELGTVFKTSNAFATALRARTPLYVDISPDGGGKSIARGVFKYTSQSQSGDVGALEEETITLRLNVPQEADTGIPWVAPFTWIFAVDTTLSQAVQIAVNAFTGGTSLYYQYLHDGTNGWKGSAVVSDVSISGGLEAMNEFTINLQASGAVTAVP